MTTVKRLADMIRRDIKAAQQAGALPDRVGEYGHVRYDVRATARTRTVNITVSGVEPLIPGYPALEVDAIQEWEKSAGADLLAAVERVRNAYNPDPSVYGGSTMLGSIFLEARATTTRIVA